MRALVLFSAMVLGAASFTAGPLEMLRGRWEPFLAGDIESLVSSYAPSAEAFLLGTPFQGFAKREELRAAWEALFGTLKPTDLSVISELEIPETRTAFVELEAKAEIGDGKIELRLLWAVAFDEGGAVVAEDLMLYGLPEVKQPPLADGAVAEGEYPHTVEAAGVTFRWLNGTVLLFGALESPGKGWVAVGFDPDYAMKGANIIFGWVKDGEAHVEDHYGSGATSHRRDKVSHVLIAAGKEGREGTTIEFVIPLVTGDPRDKDLERGKSYPIILAYHKSYDGMRRHTARGKVEIKLD